MPEVIYFDNNATTEPLAEVVEAVAACMRETYANASSVHQAGQGARHRVECARQQVASLVHADPKEVIFTSGGTESINLAIRGLLATCPDRRHVVSTAVEHSAVLRVLEALGAEGYTVELAGVDGNGLVNTDEWREKIRDDTALVSIQHANNEIGVLHDVPGLAGVAAEHGAAIHVDAVQSIGKLPVNVTDWPVHAVSMAAHKFHGPKGAGALYLRRRTRLKAMLLGGRQERNYRAGTENTAGIVGMGVAAEIAARDCRDITASVGAMRDRLEAGILSSVPFARVNGGDVDRIYNTTNVSFEGLQAEAVLILLSEAGVCASAGSACSSGSLEASHVVRAMGVDERYAHGAIRFSLSRFNTPEQVETVLSILPGLLDKLKRLAGS